MPNQYVNKVQQSNGTVLIDITDTTAVASDVATGKYFYLATGEKVEGTSSGGGGGGSVVVTEEANATGITCVITTGSEPTPPTPSETWETLLDGNVAWEFEENGDYPYCWISSLGSTPITVGSVYRVTYNNTEYRCTAKQASINGANYRVFGNPVWAGGADDGSGVPFVFIDYTNYSAWTGGLNVPNVNSTYYFKIERLVTS